MGPGSLLAGALERHRQPVRGCAGRRSQRLRKSRGLITAALGVLRRMDDADYTAVRSLLAQLIQAERVPTDVLDASSAARVISIARQYLPLQTRHARDAAGHFRPHFWLDRRHRAAAMRLRRSLSVR